MSIPTTDSSDARKEPRYNVAWRARLMTPQGTEVEVRVRDISDAGLGMVSDYSVPTGAVLNVTVGVPDTEDPKRLLAIQGRVKVMFSVMRGHDFLLGGVWAELQPAAQQYWRGWVQRLRAGSA